MTWARGSIQTIRGLVSSEWRRHEESLILDVSVPPGATATVHIPAGSLEQVHEGAPGQSAASAKGVRAARYEDGEAVLEVESGSYRFESAGFRK
jgi:alpha-L-rhamnosidase